MHVQITSISIYLYTLNLKPNPKKKNKAYLINNSVKKKIYFVSKIKGIDPVKRLTKKVKR